MGFYSYCEGCGEPMDKPTSQQILRDEYRCENCHTVNETGLSIEDVVTEILERLNDLDNKGV